jgi:DNA polymerase I
MGWPIEYPRGRRGIADVETDGLLPDLSVIHSVTFDDIDTGEHFNWGPVSVEEYQTVTGHAPPPGYMGLVEDGVRWLDREVGTLIGHNFLLYDWRDALRTVYPWFNAKGEKLILDTLIFCRMIWPEDSLIGPDMKRWRMGRMPAKYLKRQSLGAWGYRLGNYKGEFGYDEAGKPIEGIWKNWTHDMHIYMIQDGKVNLDLWRLIERRIGWNPEWQPDSSVYQWPGMPFWIEHQVAWILADQEQQGVDFDKEEAVKLIGELHNLKAELSEKLKTLFGAWWAPLDNPAKGRNPGRDRVVKLKQFPDVREERVSEKTGKPLKPYIGPPKEYYFAGAPYCRIQWTEFNPSSRRHLADRLQRVFGWTPTVFTPTGEAMVDETSIKNIPDSVITKDQRQIIMDYFVVTKTLGMVAEGNKSWMAYLRDDGKIHGRVNPLGTVTHRGAHFNPNLGQVMSVKVDEVKVDGKVVSKAPIRGLAGGYGLEARSLFRATPPWELSGTDCSSLEFICLGHDLYPYDNGVFSERVCDPTRDPHQEHGELTGLGRRDSKTVGYAYIFGAGAPNIGEQVGLAEGDDPKALAKSSSVLSRLKWLQRVQGRDYKEPNDHQKALIGKGYIVIGKFEDAIVGIKELKKALKGLAEEQGYVLALDGRKLMTRKPHASLNTRLQGNGAIICKLWMILMHKKLNEHGLTLRVDYNQVLWVHDELQFEHRRGLGDLFRKLSDEAVKEAGVMLKLRGALRTDTKTGRNWAETH